MNVENKVPAIRFKGFSGEWGGNELHQVVDVRSGRDYKHLSIGDIPVFGTGGYMLSVNKALSYDEDAIGIGRKGTIDKPYILKSPFWTVDTLFYAVPYAKNNLDFVYAIFQKINWRQKDESTGVPSLSKVAINSMSVFTTGKTEQTKIGNYFQHLDILIAQHHQKHDKLLNLKKALLEKTFPKQGAAVPEIRYKGFSGEWVEKVLGDESLEIIAGGDIDKDKISDSGKYPVLANALTNNGIVGYYKNSFRVKAPAVTVTGRGDVGHAKARNIDFTPVVRLLTIKTTHDIDFLEKAINNHAVMVESTGVPQLTVPQLSKYKIFFPKSEEQTQIGNLFKQFDTLLNQHQTQLKKLSNIKQACLEKMFV